MGTDSSTPYLRVPDFGYLMRFFQRYPHLRFISDGDPNVLTVPECNLHLVNMENIGNMELVVYIRELNKPYEGLECYYHGYEDFSCYEDFSWNRRISQGFNMAR